MTDPEQHHWWTSVSRSLRPTYGARANAAEELRRTRRTRDERAEAARALSQAQAAFDVGRRPGGGGLR